MRINVAMSLGVGASSAGERADRAAFCRTLALVSKHGGINAQCFSQRFKLTVHFGGTALRIRDRHDRSAELSTDVRAHCGRQAALNPGIHEGCHKLATNREGLILKPLELVQQLNDARDLFCVTAVRDGRGR